jgi:hypothetical protein
MDISRRVPARYLNHEPQSALYRRFRAPLLVSEILEPTFEKYFAKVERCIPMDERERSLIESDARADYDLAVEFRSMMSSSRGVRGVLA